MHGHVRVPFLETIIFPVVMQVIPSDDDRSLHLHLLYNTCEDTATNMHSTGERAFLVDVRSLDGLQSDNQRSTAIT